MSKAHHLKVIGPLVIVGPLRAVGRIPGFSPVIGVRDTGIVREPFSGDAPLIDGHERQVLPAAHRDAAGGNSGVLGFRDLERGNDLPRFSVLIDHGGIEQDSVFSEVPGGRTQQCIRTPVFSAATIAAPFAEGVTNSE